MMTLITLVTDIAHRSGLETPDDLFLRLETVFANEMQLPKSLEDAFWEQWLHREEAKGDADLRKHYFAEFTRGLDAQIQSDLLKLGWTEDEVRVFSESEPSVHKRVSNAMRQLAKSSEPVFTQPDDLHAPLQDSDFRDEIYAFAHWLKETDDRLAICKQEKLDGCRGSSSYTYWKEMSEKDVYSLIDRYCKVTFSDDASVLEESDKKEETDPLHPQATTNYLADHEFFLNGMVDDFKREMGVGHPGDLEFRVWTYKQVFDIMNLHLDEANSRIAELEKKVFILGSTE